MLRIGDMLIAAGLVTPEQLAEALRRKHASGRKLGEELVSLGAVTEVQLAQVLSNQLAVPWVSLVHVEFSRELLDMLPAELAEKFSVVPIYVRKLRAGDTLFVAMDDPTHDEALAAVRSATGLPVKAMVASASDVRNAIRVYYFGERPMAPVPRPLDARAVPLPRHAPPPPPKKDVDDAGAEASAPLAREVRRESAVEPVGEPARDPERIPKPAPPAAAADVLLPRAGRGRPLLTLTLLDGTTVRLPTAKPDEAPTGTPLSTSSERLTASDLASALLAKARGEEVGAVLGNDGWEVLFSTLLGLLIRKGLVADWEFVDEWQARTGRKPRE